MRLYPFTFLGVLSLTAGAIGACGGSTKQQASGTNGTGGSGGGATVASSATTTTTTTASSSSGEVDAGPDADDGMISTTYPAPHPTTPQVVSSGGPVLASPKFVPVFFSNEDPAYQAALTDFVTNVGSTAYWTAAVSEYGVGPATATAPVVLTEAAPSTITDDDIQSWLVTKLNADDPAWPVADANTLYVLHYPPGTGISLPSQMGLELSCQEFGGYHSSVALDGNHALLSVAYAVIPQCQNFDGIKGMDAVTGPESHELIEAVTDPYPQGNDPAYSQPDNAHYYWAIALGGGEVGDMCAQFPGVFTKFAGLNHTVQRTWSNVSALAGKDPCVPELPGEVYFNTAPVLTDTVTIEGLPMKGVSIGVGKSKTIELDLFSEGDTGGPWDVDVIDYAQLTTGKAGMTFSLDNTSGQNGQKLHLTISVLTKAQYGLGIFLITSSLGQTKSEWVGLVGE